MTGGAERLVIDICNELEKIKDIEVKLLLLSDQIDFDKKKFSFDFSIIKSHLNLSITGSNQVNLSEYENAVREFAPDIINSHLFEAELLSRWKIFPNITYITHCHDNMSQINDFSRKKSFKKNITDYYEKQILYKKYKDCDNNFIAISKDTRRYFAKMLPKKLKKNIFLLSNAIDFEKFYVKERKKTSSNRKISIVSIGSLVKKKNQAFLVPIVMYLKTKGYDCKVDVLGDGPNRASLQKQIDSCCLHKEIILQGKVKNVKDFMQKAEFYVHTATYEPFGLVILEAMAAGLPVISLDGKGNRDIIEHTKNGFIFQNQSAEQFGKTIIKLQKNTLLYKSIIEEGFNTAKKHDIINYTDKLVQLYKQAILNKG